MSCTPSKSVRIMLIATLISGFAAMGWAQGTNSYNTGGNYNIGAPPGTNYMRWVSTNQMAQGDDNLVWSHNGKYMATDRSDPSFGGKVINMIGFDKAGRIINLGARTSSNNPGAVYANTTDFTANDDRVLFVNQPTNPPPNNKLRIMSCSVTGPVTTALLFLKDPANVYGLSSPSVIYDPVAQKERLLFLATLGLGQNSTANVYTVTYDPGSIPLWNNRVALTSFTNNQNLESVKWCPELGTNYQPLLNRYVITKGTTTNAPPPPPKRGLYVFTGVRDILNSSSLTPSNFDDPRFDARITNASGGTQGTWTFDGDFLMCGINTNASSEINEFAGLFSVPSVGTNRTPIPFPTPPEIESLDKKWLCISPNGMKAAFTVNSKVVLLPLQCDNPAAQTNAGTTNIITDGSYTRVVIPGSALPQTNGGLTNFSFSIVEPTEVETNQFPSEYAGNAREFSLSGVDTQVNFTTGVEMSLHFEDADVPDGISATNMAIFLYNPQTNGQGQTGTWSQVQSIVDTNSHYVTSTNIQHFSIYALGQKLAAPSAPSGLTASSGTYTDKVALAWNSLIGADGFIVYRSESAATNSAGPIGATAGTNYNDTTAAPGTTYYFWVAATNSEGISALSASNTGYRASTPTPPTPPAAPASLSASDGTYTDKVVVSWPASDGALGYIVYRSESAATNSASPIGIAMATDYDDTTAIPNTTYYFWAAATNATGASGLSPSNTGYRASTSPVSTLSAPTGVSASDGTYTTKVAITWNSVTGATSYLIFRSQTNTTASAAQVGTSTGASYDDTGATSWPGIGLFYWVKAANSVTNSDYSVSDQGYCAAVLTGSADLAASSFTFLPALIAINAHPTYAAFVIQNKGPDTLADESVSYYFYLSRNATFDASEAIQIGGFNDTLRLGAGENASITLTETDLAYLTIPADATGSYYVFVRVRAARISDPDLSNNIAVRNGAITIDSGSGSPKVPVAGDFDGDRKNDLALYQESSGTWFVKLSASSYAEASAALGGSGYSPIGQDFDGDGKADLAVYNEVTGYWAVMLSGSSYGIASLSGFGGAGYTQMTGDYDGDRQADPAVYYQASGLWLVELSGSSYATAVLEGFGGVGYTALALDFDGDGKADPAIYQDATGNWMVRLSGSSYATAYVNTFGGTGYTQVSGMYDNDTLADAAVYETATGNWTVMLSASQYITATLWGFGGAGYAIVAGDFDGDGKVDPALYQAATATWYVRLSASGYATATANQ